MAPPLDLHLVTSRRQTFHQRRKGVKTKPLNWPYPLVQDEKKPSTIHPDRLARAGFHHTPQDDDPTVTTCFACNVQVGQWEEGEDPVYRHLAAAEEGEVECPWAFILQASWAKGGFLEGADKNENEWDKYWGDKAQFHPRGPIMQRARRGTFNLGWPHDGNAEMPTVDDIAAAGWHFAPTAKKDESDKVDCAYCGRTVSVWEEGDDPVQLHNRKDGVGCPFFIASGPGTTKSSSMSSSKSKRSKASTAPSSSASTTSKTKKEKIPVGGKKTKKVVEPVVEEGSEKEEAEEEVIEEETHEPPPTRTRATRSASVSTVATAPAPVRQPRRAKATPAPSEDEAEFEVAAPALKKSTRSRTTTASASVTAPKSLKNRKPEVNIDVDVEIAVDAPPPSTSSSSKSSKKAASSSSTSSGSSKSSKSKKKAVQPTLPELTIEQEEEENEEPEEPEQDRVGGTSKTEGKPEKKRPDAPAPARAEAPSLPADESITDLAMIANAAYELQPSSTEEAEHKKPAKKSKSQNKTSKSSVASSTSSKGKGKGKVEPSTMEEEPVVEAMQGDEEAEVEEERSPPGEVAANQRMTVSEGAAQPADASASSSVPNGRQIRSLPSKVNPSRSPSSTSLSSKAAPAPEPVPPVPTVSLASPLPSSSSIRTSRNVLVPWSTSDSATSTTNGNVFAPERIQQLLPSPTADEFATLTVGEWYELVSRRVQQATAVEHEQRHRLLVASIDAGKEKLEEMCREAKAREEAEDRAIEEKRKLKKKQLQASARKQQGSARKAVR